MYDEIRKNWRIFDEYFWNPGPLDYKEIQQRNFYYINEWLIDQKYQSLESGQYSALSMKIWNLFANLFFEKPNIYDYCAPSNFAQKTLMNPLFIDDAKVKEVIILSRNLGKSQGESKERFISKYFKHPKIRYINVEGRKSKAEALKENNIQFDVVIDDELPNIRSIAEMFRDELEKREFIIPRFGYNYPMPKDLKFLIEAKGGIITYYDEFKNSDA